MKTAEFKDFMKLDIKIGRVEEAVPVEGADKLLKLTVDTGEDTRTLVAGLAGIYNPEELIGKKLPVVVNLEPKEIMGTESRGMILAADSGGEPVLLEPDKEIPAGSRVR